ncbi:MAG: hypothetical protein ABI621_09920 [Chloroflexota bacterium]
MSNEAKQIWIISFTIALVMSISCQKLSLRNEEVIHGDETYYLINPDIILDAIAKGQTTIFDLQTVTPQPALSQSLSTVQWTQKDYLSIVEALHQFVWHESIEDWSLRYILFSLNCDDVGKGPQSAYFIFYKVVENNQQKTRFEHQIYIDPSNNSAGWSEVEYRPSLVNQDPIELSKHKISITDALQIAENNGGQEARTETANKCTVNGEYINSFDNWRISYVKTLDLFAIDVNAFTGNYKIVEVQTK